MFANLQEHKVGKVQNQDGHHPKIAKDGTLRPPIYGMIIPLGIAHFITKLKKVRSNTIGQCTINKHLTLLNVQMFPNSSFLTRINYFHISGSLQ